MGKHVIGKCNSNSALLLALCSEFELIVTNTMFKQKDEPKTTWMHPRSRHWHMIDFIITRCRDKMDIHSTRVMLGANCWTDHQMLMSKVAFRIRQKHNWQGTSKPTKLNTATLSTTSHMESLEQEMDSALGQWEEKENSTQDDEWAALQQVVYNTAKTYIGKPDRTHQDWFDPNSQELQTLMSRRDQAHQRVLQTRSTKSVLEGKSRNRSVSQMGSSKVVYWPPRSSPSTYQQCSTRLSETWGMASTYSPDRALTYSTSHTSEQRPRLLGY